MHIGDTTDQIYLQWVGFSWHSALGQGKFTTKFC